MEPKKMLKLGFTGTQEGATSAQIAKLDELFASFGQFELHHGDCIGADKAAHLAARRVGASVVIHPPLVKTKRAFCESALILPPKAYLERNKDIVDATDVLIACPKSEKEELRSGTWSTVRYARKQRKMEIIILPDGSIR